MIASSVPETVKVISSPSASVAVTVPMAVWFSAALKLEADVITGVSFAKTASSPLNYSLLNTTDFVLMEENKSFLACWPLELITSVLMEPVSEF